MSSLRNDSEALSVLWRPIGLILLLLWAVPSAVVRADDPTSPQSQHDSTDSQPGPDETGKAETGKAETGKAETGKADAGKADAESADANAIQAGPRALSRAFRIAARKATPSVVTILSYGQVNVLRNLQATTSGVVPYWFARSASTAGWARRRRTVASR